MSSYNLISHMHPNDDLSRIVLHDLHRSEFEKNNNINMINDAICSLRNLKPSRQM